MGTVVKFPDEGRIVRFVTPGANETATVIILPVVRIERHGELERGEAKPRKDPPAKSGGSRRARRR
jgi:hypothetical protein